jgi:CSLREA domain-containing protein
MRAVGYLSIVVILSIVLSIAAVSTLVPAASAATFMVTALDDVDDGACTLSHCSLREAINAANATPGADIVKFAVSGTILPTTAYTLLDPDTTINGVGAAVVVDGSLLGSPNNIFQILTSSAGFSRFTIQNAPSNGISICTGIAGCPDVAVTSFTVSQMTIVDCGEHALALCCGEKRNILITRSFLSGRGGIAISTHRPVPLVEVINRGITIGENMAVIGTEFEGIVIAEQVIQADGGSVVHDSVFIRNNLEIAGADVGVRILGGVNHNVQIFRNKTIIGADGIIVTGANHTGAPNRVAGNQVRGLDINNGTGILLMDADRTIVSKQLRGRLFGRNSGAERVKRQCSVPQYDR